MKKIINEHRIVLAVGLFTYFLIAPFYFHPDIKTIFYLAHFLKEGVFNIYDFIAQNPERSFLGPFVYPPLTYFLFGLLYFPISLLAGLNFDKWLAMGNTAVSVDNIFRYIFLLKLPVILAHLATGVLLTRFFIEKKKAKHVLLLWLFNPVSLYVVGFMGQFDGIVAGVTVVSLLYFRKRPFLSMAILGLAAAMKTYPLILIPFLAFSGSGKIIDKLKLISVGIIPYFLFIVPYLSTPAFYGDTLTSSLSKRVFDLSLPFWTGVSVPVVPIVVAMLFLTSLMFWASLGWFAAVPFVLAVGTQFHPQWLMWSLPFLTVITVKYRLWFAYAIFSLSFLSYIFLFDDVFLNLALLAPLDSGVYFLPSPNSLLSRFTDPIVLQNIPRLIIFFSGGFLVLKFFSKKNND